MIMMPPANVGRPAVASQPATMRNLLDRGSDLRNDIQEQRKCEHLHNEIGEIRGILAAMSSEIYSSERAIKAHTSDSLQTVAKVADEAKRMVSSSSHDTHQRFETVIKAVSSLAQEVEEISRAQNALNARIGDEIRVGQSVVLRATAAAGKADAIVASTEHKIMERLRGNISIIESRIGIDTSKMHTALRDEALRRECLGRDIAATQQREVDAIEKRLQKLEGATTHITRTEPIENCISGPAKQITVLGGEMTQVLEGRLHKRFGDAVQSMTSNVAFSVEQLAATLNEIRSEIEHERTARLKFELTITNIIEATVQVTAKATKHELSRCLDATMRLGLKLRSLEASISAEVESRTTRLEGALLSCTTDHKRGMVILDEKIKQHTHAILSKIDRERSMRLDAVCSSSNDAKRQLKAHSVMCAAKGLANDAQQWALTKLEIHRENQRQDLRSFNLANASATVINGSLLKLDKVCSHLLGTDLGLLGADTGLTGKQDLMEVRAILGEIVSTVVEEHHSMCLDALIARRAAEDAKNSETMNSHLTSLEARLAIGASKADANIAAISSWYEEHQRALEVLSKKVQGAGDGLRHAYNNWEKSNFYASQVTEELAARVEANMIAQSLVNGVVERQREMQIHTAQRGIEILHSKLEDVASDGHSRDIKLGKRMALAEGTISQVACDWEAAVQAVATALPTPQLEGIKKESWHTTLSSSIRSVFPPHAP